MYDLLDQLCSLERIYNELFLEVETIDWTVPLAIPEWTTPLTSGKLLYKSSGRALTRPSGYNSGISSTTSSHAFGSTLCVADAMAKEEQIHRQSKWAPATSLRSPNYWSGSVTTIESSPSPDIVQSLPRHSIRQPRRGCILKRWAPTFFRSPSCWSGSVTTIESSPSPDIVQSPRGYILIRWAQTWSQHCRESSGGLGEKSSLWRQKQQC